MRDEFQKQQMILTRIRPFAFVSSFWVFFLLISAPQVQPQEPEWEQFLEVDEEIEDRAELLEYLEWRQSNPLDINSATGSEWQCLPWISPMLAQAIIQVRHAQGPFTELDGLCQIPGFDRNLLKIIKPFITCTTTTTSNRLTVEGRHRYAIKPLNSEGFSQHVYPGDLWKANNRLLANWKNQLQLGFMLEKDPGESKFGDLMRGYLLLNVVKFKTEMILGHFIVENGQGLVFPALVQLGQTFDPVLSGRRKTGGLRPCVSSQENGGYLGAALHSRFAAVDIVLFSSLTDWDASITNDTLRSLQPSGLHRTPDERANADKLNVRTQGIVLNASFFKGLCIGLAWQQEGYSHSFLKKTAIENRFDYSSNTHWAGGLQLEYSRGALNVFSEYAHNKSGGNGFIAGLWLQDKNKSFLCSWHFYDPDFDNPRNTIMGSGAKNEMGVYMAGRWRPSRHLTIAASYDYSRNPWPRFSMPMPNLSSREAMTFAESLLMKDVTLLIRVKNHSDNQTGSFTDLFGNNVKKIVSRQRWTMTSQLDLTRKDIHLRTRIDLNLRQQNAGSPEWTTPKDSSGWMLSQQVQAKIASWFSFTARWSFFDALCFDTRFYSYENDLPGSWRSKLLYGRGIRWFLLFSCRPTRLTTLAVKWENTFYDNKDQIGSGWDLIKSDSENMISLQFDWKLRP